MGDILAVLRYLWLAVFFSVVVRCDNQTFAKQNQTGGILQYVDPMIGTSAGGKMADYATDVVIILTDSEQAMFFPGRRCRLVGSFRLIITSGFCFDLVLHV
jgi:hypothetical protein